MSKKQLNFRLFEILFHHHEQSHCVVLVDVVLLIVNYTQYSLTYLSVAVMEGLEFVLIQLVHCHLDSQTSE